ncbi:activating signal cointegrator complex subunit 2 [Microdochium nivale]|nr:activating signal cointegrator complex subunit 2 [Microdochium nivale]
MSSTLPPLAPFPDSQWRGRIPASEWESCLSIWVALIEAYLSRPDSVFAKTTAQDESILPFLLPLVKEVAASGASTLGTSVAAGTLLRQVYRLSATLLRSPQTPPDLLQWDFLADFCRVFPRKRTASVLAHVFSRKRNTPEVSLQALKKTLITGLDAGIKGDLVIVEARLKRLNHLLHASPAAASFFMAGTDFLDGLISCYNIMNPPLRKAIITTTYLCLAGLTDDEHPNYPLLNEQLYSLKAAADAHKAGPTNANDSMVPELITTTPILKHVLQQLDKAGNTAARIKSIVTSLESYRKPGGMARPKKFVKRKIGKGKGVMDVARDPEFQEMRVHRVSQISQIQDLFPGLGSGFVSQLLDEYDNDSEQVVAHLLEEDLPPRFSSMDRSKELSPERTRRRSSLAPRSTPPQLPTRHNIYDNDDLDELNVDMSSLHFGKRGPNRTADDILNDRSTAPNKAAILSALALFDADDDERDDTYDAVDAGMTVNDALADDADDQKRKDGAEELLFKAYQADQKVFDRDADTRRSVGRSKLRGETGMTDEALEGWGLMLGRDPGRLKRLELKFNTFGGNQTILESTAWKAGNEDSEGDGFGRGGHRGRGRGRGGAGRGRGNVAGPTGDKDTESARRRKESNKGSRANHNRRDQRARKMARGGGMAG